MRRVSFSSVSKFDYVCYINKTKNNIFLTCTDLAGHVKFQYSGGSIGMTGPKRNTPNAAELVGRRFAKEAEFLGYLTYTVKIKGALDGFVKSALRGLQASNIKICQIEQIKSLAHNGVRKRKQRRM